MRFKMLTVEQMIIIEGGEQNRNSQATRVPSKALFSPSDPMHLMALSTDPTTWAGNSVGMFCFPTPPIPSPSPRWMGPEEEVGSIS